MANLNRTLSAHVERAAQQVIGDDREIARLSSARLGCFTRCVRGISIRALGGSLETDSNISL